MAKRPIAIDVSFPPQSKMPSPNNDTEMLETAAIMTRSTSMIVLLGFILEVLSYILLALT